MLKNVTVTTHKKGELITWIIAFEFTDRENLYSLYINNTFNWKQLAEQLSGLGKTINLMWDWYHPTA